MIDVTLFSLRGKAEMPKIVNSNESKSHLEFFLDDDSFIARKSKRLMIQKLDEEFSVPDPEETLFDPEIPRFNSETPRCSTKLYRILLENNAYMPGRSNELDTIDVLVQFAVIQCAPFNAVWRIEPNTAKALLRTELPFDRFPFFPRLPFQGLYLSLPKGIFQLENVNGGSLHDIEGFYLAEEHIWDSKAQIWNECILVVGVAENVDGVHPYYEKVFSYFFLFKDKPFEKSKDNDLVGISELIIIVVNLLWALHTKHLRQVAIEPRLPRSPGKRKKRSRQGLTMRPYSVVQLTEPRRASRSSQVPLNSRKQCLRPVVVRGHWRSYWVLDPNEETVLEVKERKRTKSTAKAKDLGQLHRVSRWIHPYIINADLGDSPTSKAIVKS
jgi:hypothetical protein